MLQGRWKINREKSAVEISARAGPFGLFLRSKSSLLHSETALSRVRVKGHTSPLFNPTNELWSYPICIASDRTETQPSVPDCSATHWSMGMWNDQWVSISKQHSQPGLGLVVCVINFDSFVKTKSEFFFFNCEFSCRPDLTDCFMKKRENVWVSMCVKSVM